MHLSGRRVFNSEVNLLLMASVVFFSALVSGRHGKNLLVLLFSFHMMKVVLKMSKKKTTSLPIAFTVLRLSVHHVVLSLHGPNLIRLNLQPISSISCRKLFPQKKVTLTISVSIRHVRLCELQSAMVLGTYGRKPPVLLWMPIITLIIMQMMNYAKNIVIQLQQMAVHQILLVKRLVKMVCFRMSMVCFRMSESSIPRLVNNSMLGLVALSPF